MTFRVKFWGVRGSIACPSPNHIVYGGNTSCLEVNVGGRHLIFDSGTGIRNLGRDMVKRGLFESNILLTHTHWDHINGFPFFAPAFQAKGRLRIFAGHLADQGGVRGVLSNQMANPVFPVPLEALQATLEFVDFPQGDTLTFGEDVVVKTALLNHPDGATGYRIDHKGASACYVTDTEHRPGERDPTILTLISGADLVVYDSTYTDEEFPSKIGWGHSTWQEGVRLCQAADVKKLAIFHHDPDHDDAFMAQIEKDARAMWSGAIVARETVELTVP